ncbi:MAG: 2-amino-4-hydroxy-6-hydroxymethyldihydropteridine diphosphokinase [Deferribacteres bacterium]|jgi:2-amino-4-hydroxy-6-hydroxymethyldihydropteridine diphosphokinase|nr:2-amino-4-hydroxy-6-hydroxymethyldihydropteridine pyrophosphokinase [Deferribacteraceae bacterium]MDK2792441.1 2-amino-4-hydroxy-6-hydroxymethyldihydropteridine diphosphokinase [Deferribacteres bacterium]
MSRFCSVLNIGSNIGNKSKNLAQAVKYIANMCGIIKVSSVYGTDSMLLDEQERYFNCAVFIKTNFSHLDLLYFVKKIEGKMGRVNTGRWKERIIDIDIVDFDGQIFKSKQLTLPHYDMENRSFFLWPLREICPYYIHPEKKINIGDMIGKIKNNFNITLLGELLWR